jgi:hypothetical protein
MWVLALRWKSVTERMSLTSMVRDLAIQQRINMEFDAV